MASWQHPAVCKPRAIARATPALTSNLAIVVDWRPTGTRVQQHCITFLRTVPFIAISTVLIDSNVWSKETNKSASLTGGGGYSRTHFVYGKTPLAMDYCVISHKRHLPLAASKNSMNGSYVPFRHCKRGFCMECTATDKCNCPHL